MSLSSSSLMGGPLALSLEKLLEQAQASGELNLGGRNLKTFPKHCRQYSLEDTVVADLSRNKLNEVPEECTTFNSMEKFLLYHNSIKSIPNSIVALQSLQFLDLSRNQLSYLPANICQLPLQGLIVNNNRLVSLPEEIGKMQTLMELDVSCNEIAHLPVQIGDLSSLKSLKLRRNHLQEIPIEISYLQLTTLDLSGNRISILPVELRFMITVVELNLEENPLTCPPANLCSRGRIHIYKYLEVQAIKEDRKRGVLTDSEYRRSYRKTGGAQLNDMGFNNFFSNDARRKRNTADSGYGSEQPLDRRWSQDFSQETADSCTEDAKRFVLRAAYSNPISRPSNRVGCYEKKVPPLTSSGSSTSSSGYSSVCGSSWEQGNNGNSHAVGDANSYQVNRDLKIPTLSGSTTPCLPTSNINGLEDEFHKIMDGMFISQERNPSCVGITSGSPITDSDHSLKSNSRDNSLLTQKSLGKHSGNGPSSQLTIHSGAKPVISKLPSPRHTNPLPIPPSQESKFLPQKSATNVQNHIISSSKVPSRYAGLTSQTSNNKSLGNGCSGLPLPSKQSRVTDPQSKAHVHSYRQYKEHLRQQRHSDLRNGLFSYSNNESPMEDSSRDAKSRLVSHSQFDTNSSAIKSNGSSFTYDVKTMQKEAVLSYVKSKSHRQNEINSAPSKQFPSGSSIPQPSLNAPRQKNLNNPDQTKTFTARREAEKSATTEAHINQLRMHLENRLRLTLSDDIAGSLVDGVILCHMANHVKPRSVPSIHVPSPAVPKLTTAKCRHNVENFLLACRKIGVRDEDLFVWGNVYPHLEPERILKTLQALEGIINSWDVSPTNLCSSSSSSVLSRLEDPRAQPHYPDLVPIEETTNMRQANLMASKRNNTEISHHKHFESLFLFSMLFGTASLLYFFPPPGT